MPDELLQRLRRFHDDAFPRYQEQFKELVDDGQHPTTLFIGCSDSRLVPYLLTGAGPGELFMVRNVGALVPPCCGTHDGGHHGTAAAIEFAVLNLKVRRIVVCGHSHCGAIKALYEDISPEARNLRVWLDLAREATPPVQPTPEALRRTEQRAVVLQLERLMDYPMVRSRVERGELSLHGWHYVIEDGEVHVFDVKAGGFVPASRSSHSGTGPFLDTTTDAAAFSEATQATGAGWTLSGARSDARADSRPCAADRCRTHCGLTARSKAAGQ